MNVEQTYERHPIATDICPEMNLHDLVALTEDIAAHGLIYPIIRHEGKFLKGWARYSACLKAGIAPVFRDFNPDQDGDPREFVFRSLLLRRNMEKLQRAMIVARFVTSSLGFNQTSEGTTIGAAAQTAQVSTRSVDRALAMHRKFPLVADAVASGRLTSKRCAESLCKLPEQRQHKVLEGDCSGDALKKAIKHEEREWIESEPVDLPEGRYAVVAADPAWRVDKTPYPTMTVGEIEADLAYLLEEKAAEHCHLFLWATQAYLPDAISIVRRLGWTYKFLMTWRKSNGSQNPRGPMYNSEFVVVATRGSPAFIDIRDFKTCFDGQKRRHSQKPKEFYEMINRVTRGPRLDLYARDRHDGFEAHGNQVIAPEPIMLEPQRSTTFGTRAKASRAKNRSLPSPATKLETIWLIAFEGYKPSSRCHG